MKTQIAAWTTAHAADMAQLCRTLHGLAETSWQETATTAYIRQELERMNLICHTFDDHTGIVAEWRGPSARREPGAGVTVAMRADLDALFQYVNNAWQANHSCGHDAHMTMVLSAVRCLQAVGFQPGGTLLAIFQPAEEVGEGAKAMVRTGLLKDVDYLLGIHLRPAKELPFGEASGAIYHGSSLFLDGSLKGLQAHASRPADGINAIDALAAVVSAVNAINAGLDAPASCKVTRAASDNAQTNVIPDSATFSIDLRAPTNPAMDRLLEQVRTAIRRAGSANGAEVALEAVSRTAAAVPCPEMERIVDEAISELLGDQGRAPPPVTPGGEDFHFYPQLVPGLKATMIGLGCDLLPGLHHPQMRFHPDALPLGTAILALSVVKLFDMRAASAPALQKEGSG